jgi:ATP-dependent DNA helicase RecG
LTFIDIKKFNQPIINILETSESYVKEKINWHVEFIDFKRVEIPEIPIKAVREALVNSLIHRDYNNPKGNEIAIFKNRIEIYNPGSFPLGLTPEDYIHKQERSYLRNPKIAEIFYLTKDVEKWGSGLKRIYYECLEKGVKVSFTSVKTGFITTFFRPVKKEKHVSTNPQIAEQLQKLSKTLGIRWSERWSERWSDLTFREQQIILLILHHPKITRTKMAQLLKINPSAVQKHLEKLKNKNIIKRIGSDKGGFWEIIET